MDHRRHARQARTGLLEGTIDEVTTSGTSRTPIRIVRARSTVPFATVSAETPFSPKSVKTSVTLSARISPPPRHRSRPCALLPTAPWSADRAGHAPLRRSADASRAGRGVPAGNRGQRRRGSKAACVEADAPSPARTAAFAEPVHPGRAAPPTARATPCTRSRREIGRFILSASSSRFMVPFALGAQCRAAGFGSARGAVAASPPGIGIDAAA